MNRPESSKYVPGLPAEDNIDTPTNENASSKPDSIKIYDGVADCPVNDSDNLKSVKSRAKDLAIQKVQQKIADYVYSFLKYRYLTLPDDETLSISNEICTITDVKYNIIDYDDKILIRATVIAQIDDNDIMNYLIWFFKERAELKSQNEALRKQNEKLKHENEKLNHQIKVLNAPANQKFKKASALQYNKEDYEGAIRLYDEAIKLNPNCPPSTYYNRGKAYQSLNQYDLAIQDYSKAIELKPNYFKAYYHRGDAYYALKQYELAIQDYDKVIQFKPNLAEAYYRRGCSYYCMKKYQQALKDFDKALEINPNSKKVKNNRETCLKVMSK